MDITVREHATRKRQLTAWEYANPELAGVMIRDNTGEMLGMVQLNKETLVRWAEDIVRVYGETRLSPRGDMPRDMFTGTFQERQRERAERTQRIQ